MGNLDSTQYFNVKGDPEIRVKDVLDLVYNAMAEKGYNPVNQIVGYIMSGDPTYITSYKGARSTIIKIPRDDQYLFGDSLVVKEYIKNESWKHE